MSYRTAIWVVQQAMIEMGLNKPAQLVASTDITVQQMLGLLNRAGTDMVIGFPWEQLTKEYVFNTANSTVDGLVLKQPLPADWSYFLDQTQWDRTNHWPLLGPKTAQEWQWLKGGLLSSGPRIRYRVVGGFLELFPSSGTPPSTPPTSEIAMEYVADTWVQSSVTANTFTNEVLADEDIILFDPWVISAYLKLKYWEAKGLDTTAYSKDFVGTWEARIGKNKGAPVLTLAPRARSMLIGINNIPDGSWNVGNGSSP
jgi:hypothetical protein